MEISISATSKGAPFWCMTIKSVSGILYFTFTLLHIAGPRQNTHTEDIMRTA